ncbi:bifunctional 5,10-methylenetetrahydrofolate dehydrogenase/5,10-methenyltetrahydrofolate cyclohydrolase [Sphingomonas oryzagri]|uniref:Bifunctional protein FolD n=1 Tax=Sphingomonas oryzagri TaxID=3042314 RepID=A0ABT6N3E6_9SPHN|nr:tetrahydrofolate dehydrogenase/cyclohydrolase catalytic domain-containing protein [Sphingomonas oryzagri]MDH7639288.1 tetrahydrofolate dehydrogenase/cyclohydrolase catalytic domain-containing protein [Sphingomonas oryzagri]
MTAILRGDLVARELDDATRIEVERLRADGIDPSLAVVLVGEDPASEIYVRRKRLAAEAVGIRSIEHRLGAATSQQSLLALIATLNADPGIHGILVQLPLPPQIASDEVLGAITPHKDVDGFHPVNVGRLSTGTGGLIPCTPLGCMLLLDRVIADFRGLKAVVIGKSNIVGKPVAMLLLERECTVTITHIHTRGLPEIARTADIIVAAAGSPGLVRGDWVKPGAVLIDVGINRIAREDGKTVIVGDVAANECDHAAVLTPVPRGVGPMTIACLLRNTVQAARLALA